MASAAAPYRGVQREWKGREAVGWRRLPRRGRFLLVFADFDDVSKVYREPACIIPTVKLNCLAMKRQKAAISIPLYQKPAPPREQIIIFVVKVGHEITTGTGPKKKIAKRNASKAVLLQLGCKASSLLQEQSETLEEIKRWNCQNVGCPEPKTLQHSFEEV
ncbi:double-stranded RNA-binding protein Staufen homolog 2 isoform X2 [Crotalus tigris]|uniref:double-stranded RNA-binding protein Staufen homolog 2 isoform X2 n=1 Tax=Crotalus tigris TaxID=88082 RepID=UPI00192FB0EC|nr:double-stranded RNA-binding protein Staufen homolog 2 isoform X2 [Crotalus tigris]